MTTTLGRKPSQADGQGFGPYPAILEARPQRFGLTGVGSAWSSPASTSPHVPPSYPDDNRKGLGSEREGYSNRGQQAKGG